MVSKNLNDFGFSIWAKASFAAGVAGALQQLVMNIHANLGCAFGTLPAGFGDSDAIDHAGDSAAILHSAAAGNVLAFPAGGRSGSYSRESHSRIVP
jgi:hypothetical protein